MSLGFIEVALWIQAKPKENSCLQMLSVWRGILSILDVNLILFFDLRSPHALAMPPSAERERQNSLKAARKRSATEAKAR
jgi:hypothetical protein